VDTSALNEDASLHQQRHAKKVCLAAAYSVATDASKIDDQICACNVSTQIDEVKSIVPP
jgi:hypothetical protein